MKPLKIIGQVCSFLKDIPWDRANITSKGEDYAVISYWYKDNPTEEIKLVISFTDSTQNEVENIHSEVKYKNNKE